jgi:tripartite-type tricarboxylate transporter receptor subunit TctC
VTGLQKQLGETMMYRRAAFCLAAFPWLGAWAPDRPVRMFVGFAAGGGTDITARLMAEPMRASLGQPVLIETRTGSSGQIAALATARAAPDGTTLLLATAGEIVNAPLLSPGRLPYDPARDLLPITNAVRVPNVLVVGAGVPANTTAELLALARAQPGVLTYGSSGVGNLGHLNGELLNRLGGVQITHVPYRGVAAALADVVAGRVSMFYSGLPALLPLMREGRLKAIGVTSATRMRSLPEVPALAETPALAGYELENWFGLFAPAGLTPAMTEAIHAAAVGALRDGDVARRLAEQGVEPAPGTPAEFEAFLARQRQVLGEIIRSANITLEG